MPRPVIPEHPERGATLLGAFDLRLAEAVAQRPRDLAARPLGSGTRYGPARQAHNAHELMQALYEGNRVNSVEATRALLGVQRRVEAAALYAAPNGPGQMQFNPLLEALIYATACGTYEFAPALPTAIVVGAPNSPLPGVHAGGKRVAAGGPPFGVGRDGHQRMAAIFLSTVYGPQDAFGYSLALTGLVYPSSRDTPASARRAGRELAVDSPAEYLGSLLRLATPIIDSARPGSRPLPAFVIDPRRDRDPSHGTSLDDVLDVPVEDANWGAVFSTQAERRTVLIEAGDPARVGGGGLNPHLVYRSPDGFAMDAATVRDAIEGRNAEAHRRLAPDMGTLAPDLFKTAGGEESITVLALRGHVYDDRNGQRAKLLIMLPAQGPKPCYAVMPIKGDGDPFHDLDRPGHHVAVQRDIVNCALIHVGPSRWTGVCRRNSYLYANYCYLPAKECSVREHAFTIGSSARLIDLEFPGGMLLDPLTAGA